MKVAINLTYSCLFILLTTRDREVSITSLFPPYLLILKKERYKNVIYHIILDIQIKNGRNYKREYFRR